METWVFVDTCIWASFFGKPSSPEKKAIDSSAYHHLTGGDPCRLVRQVKQFKG